MCRLRFFSRERSIFVKRTKLGLLCCVAALLLGKCFCMEDAKDLTCACSAIGTINANSSANAINVDPKNEEVLDPKVLHKKIMDEIQRKYLVDFLDKKPFSIMYKGIDVTVVPKGGYVFDVLFHAESFVKSFKKTDFCNCNASFSSPLGVGNRIDPADSIASSHVRSEAQVNVESSNSNNKQKFDCKVRFLFRRDEPCCFDLVKPIGSNVRSFKNKDCLVVSHVNDFCLADVKAGDCLLVGNVTEESVRKLLAELGCKYSDAVIRKIKNSPDSKNISASDPLDAFAIKLGLRNDGLFSPFKTKNLPNLKKLHSLFFKN